MSRSRLVVIGAACALLLCVLLGLRRRSSPILEPESDGGSSVVEVKEPLVPEHGTATRTPLFSGTSPRADAAASSQTPRTSAGDSARADEPHFPAQYQGHLPASEPLAIPEQSTRWHIVPLRDIPVPWGYQTEQRLSCIGDFDGDHRADLGLFVPAKMPGVEGHELWRIRLSCG